MQYQMPLGVFDDVVKNPYSITHIRPRTTPPRSLSLTFFHSFLKNYNTTAGNILREAFNCHYLQTVEVQCNSVDTMVCRRRQKPLFIYARSLNENPKPSCTKHISPELGQETKKQRLRCGPERMQKNKKKRLEQTPLKKSQLMIGTY